MIFQENRLLADDSHEISYCIFFEKFGKMLQKLPSAAVVIGALRVNLYLIGPVKAAYSVTMNIFRKKFFSF